MTEAETHRTEAPASRRLMVAPSDLGAAFTRGVAAGLFGGFAFIVANMYYALNHGKPAVAPLLAISTIFRGSNMPMMDPQDVIIGLVTHIGLSMLFGIGFGLLVAVLRLTTKPVLVTVAALVYGLLLYVVNFQILARIWFPFLVNPKGPNQLFELWIHPVAFGLFLVPFFLGAAAFAGRTRD